MACDNWEAVLKGASLYDEGSAKNVSMGLRALGAVEDKFTCSGMCKVSTFYTFSDVS